MNRQWKHFRLAAALLAGGLLFANIFTLAAKRFGEISATESYATFGEQLREDVVADLASTWTFEAPPVVVQRPTPNASTSGSDPATTGPVASPTTVDAPTPLPLPPNPFFAPFTVAIAVDRRVAAPGDVLTYTITVTNLDDRHRSYLLTSHIPEQTVTHCPDPTVPSVPSRPPRVSPCVPQAATSPDQHDVTAVLSRVPPSGSRTFLLQVEVLPSAVDGSVITNHAHARHGDTERTTDTVGTKVKP